MIQVGDFLVEIEETEVAVEDLLEDDALIVPKGKTTPMGGEIAEKVTSRLANATEGVSSTIASVCRYVQGAFEAANRPDEVKVKFGLKIAGEAGIPYLTKGSGQAVLEIEATWRNSSESAATAGESAGSSESDSDADQSAGA